MQRSVDPPSQRNTHRQPGQHHHRRSDRIGTDTRAPVQFRRGSLVAGQTLFLSQLCIGHEPLVGQRTHQQVADQADHQHARKDVHGLVVDLFARNAQPQLVLAHVVHHHRTQHTGGSPGGKQAAVNGAHHLGTKQVSQVRRYCGKAAAVHAKNDAKGRYKQHDAAGCRAVQSGTRGRAARHAEIHQATEHKEDNVGHLSAQLVGQAGPEKAATNIEQTQQRGETGRYRGNGGQLGLVKLAELFCNANQGAAKYLLQHGRSHADHTDTGAHVHAQHHPDQPELGNAPNLFHVYVTLRDHGIAGLCQWRGPAVGLPAGFRYPVGERTGHHENKVNQRHDDKSLHHTHTGGRCKILHQVGRQRRADHGTAAKTHDGHPGRHAAAVGEPLDKCRYRRNVAQAEPDAANHPGAKKHQPELMQINAESGNQHAAAPADGRHNTRLARTHTLQPAAPNGRR